MTDIWTTPEARVEREFHDFLNAATENTVLDLPSWIAMRQLHSLEDMVTRLYECRDALERIAEHLRRRDP